MIQTSMQSTSSIQNQNKHTQQKTSSQSHNMSNKKKYTLNTTTINLGCSCKTPKFISNIFHPKPKNHKLVKLQNHHSSSSTSSTDTNSPTTFSGPESDPGSDIRSLRAVQGFGKIGGQSMAVEKDSDDPYVDFRNSMVQMILEKEIYTKEDLKELLNCFLQLNSPYYHGVIVRAFTEIWNGVYSGR